MTIPVLDSEQFAKISREAIDQIQLGKTHDWINISTLIRKAYYLGIIYTLMPISEEKDMQELLVKLFMDTRFSSDLDSEINQAIDKWKNG